MRVPNHELILNRYKVTGCIFEPVRYRCTMATLPSLLNNPSGPERVETLSASRLGAMRPSLQIRWLFRPCEQSQPVHRDRLANRHRFQEHLVACAR